MFDLSNYKDFNVRFVGQEINSNIYEDKGFYNVYISGQDTVNALLQFSPTEVRIFPLIVWCLFFDGISSKELTWNLKWIALSEPQCKVTVVFSLTGCCLWFFITSQCQSSACSQPTTISVSSICWHKVTFVLLNFVNYRLTQDSREKYNWLLKKVLSLIHKGSFIRVGQWQFQVMRASTFIVYPIL